MNFLALIVGLTLERLLTQLFHLRAFHWLDPLFAAVWARFGNVSQARLYALYVLLAAVLVLPVALLELGLQNRLAYIPEFVFAVAVLVMCLGPRDLVEEVSDYREALASGDTDRAEATASELLERPSPEDEQTAVAGAVYVQANNRIFGVVFWFIVLGAAGAWLFRVIDLLRQYAVARTAAEPSGSVPLQARVVIQLHWLLAWIPTRLLLVGYTLAGSYEGAVRAWKSAVPDAAGTRSAADAELLVQVGEGAAGLDDEADASAKVQAALDLVSRTLWIIWCPILALLTLYDWIS